MIWPSSTENLRDHSRRRGPGAYRGDPAVSRRGVRAGDRYRLGRIRKAETRGNLVTSILLNFDELEQHNIKLQEKYERIKGERDRLGGVSAGRCRCHPRRLRNHQQDSQFGRGRSRKEGIKVGLFRPVSLFPFPKAAPLLCRARSCTSFPWR